MYTDVAFYEGVVAHEVPDVPMNPIVRDAWADALESGDYLQGRGRLVTRNLAINQRWLCCLGVLCELAVHAGILHSESEGYNGYRTVVESENGPRVISVDNSVLPEVVARWAGLATTDPIVYYPHPDDDAPRRVRLSYLNDDVGADFPAIAAAIRSSL